ncbi:toll/interleukin-1 receptor domain-containing protein [Accumulibacter sp.]|uniref:toll/interleukin-1 receptor domain-containing protein n=1 Tax=Accumulibacter sp. TaxID=2053492 RepID=UPI001A5C11A8|nr:toll/interleukin-1 receptor domain-containing protein [Accumulibacter sp.]MBL8375487.1 toll/interleukin-1 receptor domain-containing protein [Accumulibacter sp.]
MNDIFISYRKDDAKAWAISLRDNLAKAFGEEHVFLDQDTLHAGAWREQLDAALAHCVVVVLVIGKRWLTASDAQGRRRLDLPDDVHRQEVIVALTRPGITVIPVIVDDAPLPHAASLPEPLLPLLEQQARPLADSAARRAVDLKLLFDDIQRATGLRARSLGEEGRALSVLGRIWHALRTALLAFMGTLVLSTGLSLADVRVGSMEMLVLFLVALAGVGAAALWRRRHSRSRDGVRPG